MPLGLSLVHHHLSHSQIKGAREAIDEASELLAKLKGELEGSAANLQLQLEVLRACLHVGEGNIEALTSSGKFRLTNLASLCFRKLVKIF